MTWKVAGLGAEPKKMMLLGALVLVAAYFLIPSGDPRGSGSSSTSAARPAVIPAGAAMPTEERPGFKRTRPNQRSGSFQEFHPSLRPKKEGEFDRASIDPTLRLDLLEKLQNVKVEGTTRSLFEAASAPPAEVAKLNVAEPKKILPRWPAYGPEPPAKPGPPPPKPQAPPIPLKFYGFLAPARAGVKRAFFLDGDDIIVATEGQLVKNRYKIVRIGVNSAVVEDTQFENHQQTLPLIEEQQG